MAVVDSSWLMSDFSGLILPMLGSYNIRGFGMVNGGLVGLISHKHAPNE